MFRELLTFRFVSHPCVLRVKKGIGLDKPSLHLTLLHLALWHAWSALTHGHAVGVSVVLCVASNLLHRHAGYALCL